MLAGGTRQEGCFFCVFFFSGWRRRQDFAGGGRGESTQGGKTMLVGGGRVRCAVCADESFSFKKKISWSCSGGGVNLTVCVEP